MQYELSLASRKFSVERVRGIDQSVSMSFENSAFTPPASGAMWVKYDYTEADSVTYGLSRKCKYYIGMVQLSVFFSPGTGIDKARSFANQLAESIEDGTILDSGYIYEAGVVHPPVKSQSGWFIPVRFYVRID